MKLKTDVTINGKLYPQGKEVPWLMIYPFFMVHMLAFGSSGFFMAYSDDGPPILFLYLHGGIAITAYLAFYRQYFGRDEIRWMFINAALGLIGITVEIDWLLSLYGRTVDSYPIYVHVIPFLYYILYTFLLRQAVLDLTRSRDNEARRKRVEQVYVVGSLVVYLGIYLFG
ncbi:MAG: hypothetical protein A3H44_14325 [Gammaproteobacteria bacterium RIFCSPLOWO2_02_FULL_57_10]|nr:MAG: hypothetical protein A3H44_14325 [Gammaproteobacteria bacterium RIFCSPLOWO2_02_FULL_57_10]